MRSLDIFDEKAHPLTVRKVAKKKMVSRSVFFVCVYGVVL